MQIQPKSQRIFLTIIRRENKICEAAIRYLKEKCDVFEKKYLLPSDSFYSLFQKGEMGDEQDFFEWKALIDGISEWEQSRQALERLTN
ncbi:MAG TPA: hypothetical protein DCQ37_07780 [Desulfobacteraceae bacterium]|nr:hypothetical protein [Desulfobacteraceae bacterium]